VPATDILATLLINKVFPKQFVVVAAPDKSKQEGDDDNVDVIAAEGLLVWFIVTVFVLAVIIVEAPDNVIAVTAPLFVAAVAGLKV